MEPDLMTLLGIEIAGGMVTGLMLAIFIELSKKPKNNITLRRFSLSSVGGIILMLFLRIAPSLLDVSFNKAILYSVPYFVIYQAILIFTPETKKEKQKRRKRSIGKDNLFIS